MRLHQRRLGSIELAAGYRALLEQFDARVHDGLAEIEIRLRLGNIEFGSGEVFRGRSLGCGFEGGLSGRVAALVVQLGGGKVAIFKRGEKFALVNARSTLHIELLDRLSHLGRDGRLGERRKDGVGRYPVGDASLPGISGLDVNLRRGRDFGLLAPKRKQK